MFNKALFWIFVWFLKTWKKSSPLSEIYTVRCIEVAAGCEFRNFNLNLHFPIAIVVNLVMVDWAVPIEFAFVTIACVLTVLLTINVTLFFFPHCFIWY